MISPAVPQRGMALIAVLWLVAAMSVILAGVVQSVRGEIQTTGIQRQALMASSIADAEILLALQSLQAVQWQPPNKVQRLPVQFGGRSGEVEIQPLNGYIDINNAPPLLLADMYQYAGGLSAAAAITMAQATTEARQKKNNKGAVQGFDSVEDLFLIPQMTYDLYVKIHESVTAEIKYGTGRANVLAAPLSVLQVLTGGDESKAAAFLAHRAEDSATVDTSFFNPVQVDKATSRSLRFKVAIALPDGGVFHKSWDVYLGLDARSGLPWRVLNSRQYVQNASQNKN